MNLTSRQITSRQNKIKKYRAILAKERREWGGYHDGSGIRYIIPELYVETEDYKGALTYFRWFKKNFPDDCGFQEVLLIWTRTLFENGKTTDAKYKAIETAINNIYLIPVLLGLEIEEQNLPAYDDAMGYAAAIQGAPHFEYIMSVEFCYWLNETYQSLEYQQVIGKYIDLSILLNKTEGVTERTKIINQISELRESCT